MKRPQGVPEPGPHRSRPHPRCPHHGRQPARVLRGNNHTHLAHTADTNTSPPLPGGVQNNARPYWFRAPRPAHPLALYWRADLPLLLPKLLLAAFTQVPGEHRPPHFPHWPGPAWAGRHEGLWLPAPLLDLRHGRHGVRKPGPAVLPEAVPGGGGTSPSTQPLRVRYSGLDKTLVLDSTWAASWLP